MSILATAHIIAIAPLIPLDLPVWARLMLGLAVLYSMWRCLRNTQFLAPPSGTSLTLEGDEAVLLKSGGQPFAGRVLPSSAVSPFLIVLNIAPKGVRRARSVIILPDSLDAESFRQLRVQLRWGMQHRGAAYPAHPGF